MLYGGELLAILENEVAAGLEHVWAGAAGIGEHHSGAVGHYLTHTAINIDCHLLR